MANLLPSHAKKTVLIEYWSRVAVVWMFLVAGAAAIVTVLMVPTYVLIDAQYDALAIRFDTMREKQEAFNALEAEIAEANTLARHIDQNDDTVSVRALIDQIEALAGRDVVITRYTFSQAPGETAPMTIGGIADTRTSLAAFRDALAADERFASVELPIASLAADRNLPFSITLVLRNE